jgi:hypothetical protein
MDSASQLGTMVLKVHTLDSLEIKPDVPQRCSHGSASIPDGLFRSPIAPNVPILNITFREGTGTLPTMRFG